MSAPALPANDRTGAAPKGTELRVLFHRLDNHHGAILGQPALLELHAQDDARRLRASQIVMTTLQARGTRRELSRRHGE